MTILDLINKSVTDEKMPCEVEFNGFTYKYMKSVNDYRNENGVWLFNFTDSFSQEVTIPKTGKEIQREKDQRRFEALTDFLRAIADVEKEDK